jgi:hypothetical protein
LDRRGEVLLCRQSELPRVLGRPLPEEHRRTLEHVWEVGETTSASLLARKNGLSMKASEVGREGKLSTISSRLTALWKAGLLERVEGTAPSGGREHRYFAFV